MHLQCKEKMPFVRGVMVYVYNFAMNSRKLFHNEIRLIALKNAFTCSAAVTDMRRYASLVA